ncbi:MAG: hypothetical protein PHC34_11545 [Candidatus Gastranaerophilales bacterium]|nr:hypothetical protein [Candidatus Gastranaerophilales bacterium]
MKKIRNIGLILFFILIISGSAFVLAQNRSESSNVSMNMANNSNQSMYLALAQSKKSNFNNQQTKTLSNEDDEDTVIINVSNFGRSNPFKPFVEKSLMNDSLFQNPQINVPKPPEYDPDPNFSTLLGIKVSGILYDNTRPSAIINVDNNDYLVHKGDFLFNFYVKDITSDKIAIKYENNIYKAGIGEIIEGIINVNPVRSKQMFADYKKSDIKLVNPVNLPALPTLR